MKLEREPDGAGPTQLTPEEIDAALRAAYGGTAPRPPNVDSVLEHLCDVVGDRPTVTLREPAGSERRAGQLPPIGSAGRFEVLEELGRGGLGVVLRGHDVDLGRDVAMKVLHHRHVGDPAMVHKLVDEARIGGQLEHPGIVPVYEMGIDAAGRPFFAMKLVAGRTLASLLHARHDVDDDRTRLLSIFTQVCQAVGYAHARGVVHRDLKPSNVMVGAFGEVQVVDWGLAKVVDRAAAEPAVIAGTPAYMAPEQARGDDGAVDARADVFGLGAILCEILTGRSPFSGSTADETRRAAAAADLAPARQALAACGAEPDLRDLALRCIDPDPARRPPHGTAVAEAVTAHLASVENRARAAELQLARAETRALEERRRRRLAAALACAVIVIVALGGGGLAWIRSAARLRAERAEAQVQQAIERTQAALGAARASDAADVEVWSAALAAAREAIAIAAAPDVREPVRERTRSALADAEAGGRAANAAAARRALEARVRERLHEIREERADDWTTSVAQHDAAYAAAFRELGIDVDVEPQDAGSAVSLVHRSPLTDDLIAALDDWVRMLTRSGHDASRDPATLRTIAISADPDPVRLRLRTAWFEADQDAMLALSADPERPTWPAATQGLLGFVLSGFEHSDEARHVLTDAQLRYPDDFWISHDLALLWSTESPEGLRERVRYLSAALALRPHSHHVQVDLAQTFDFAGESARGILHAREALRLRPDLAPAHAVLCRCLVRTGDVDDAVAAGREAVRLAPEVATSWDELGHALYRAGDADGTLAACREALARGERTALRLDRLGVALDDVGEHEAAITTLREALELEPDLQSAHVNLGVALVAVGHYDEAIVEYRIALEMIPDDYEVWVNLGNTWLHKGDAVTALAAYREASRYGPDHVKAWIGIAAASTRLGDVAQAIAAHREAIRLAPTDLSSYEKLAALLLETGASAEAAQVARSGLAVERTANLLATLGGALRGADHATEALEVLQEALRLEPDLVAAHLNLGPALRTLGRLDEAEAHLRRALELAPDLAIAHMNLGVVLEDRHDLEGARGEYTEATRLDPGNAVAWYDLGLAHDKLRDYELAASCFERAVELAPDRTDFRYELGRSCVRLGDLSGGLDGLQEVVRRAPDHLRALVLLADLQWMCGETVRIRELLDRARDLAGDDRDGLVDVGRMYARNGWYEDAREMFDRATALGEPGTADAAARCTAAIEQGRGLQAVLALEAPLESPQHALELGQLALRKEMYQDAADLLGFLIGKLGDRAPPEAFFAAALAATALGFGVAAPSDRPDAPTWRQQAVQWLDRALEGEAARIRGLQAADRGWYLGALRGWSRRPQLAPLRDPARLGLLDDDERAAVEAFWARYEAVICALTQSSR
ncbi:MAG: tetratricopeptide repeat protein [Planctomycetes bacterium]|nr:tetratricopeptide repeat protein [Planctomycetota bacterium]